MGAQIGFSTGTLRNEDGQRLSLEEATSFFLDKEIKVIELSQSTLGYLRSENNNFLDILKLQRSDLERLTLHLGTNDLESLEITKNSIEIVNELHKDLELDGVVVHPDLVLDFDLLSDLEPEVLVENMDWRKSKYNTFAEVKELLDRYPNYSLCLDVNHIYTIDPKMKEIDQYLTIKDKIKQIHISGFFQLHDPLFKTKQDQIIKKAKEFNVPLVIESQILKENAMKELEYIQTRL